MICQCLAIVLAATALARPMTPGGEGPRRSWLILRDVSASVGDQADLPSPLEAELPQEQVRFADTLLAAGQEADADAPATRLTPALRLAGRRLADNRTAGVVLMTDGCFDDDWPPAATRLANALAEAKATLYIVPLDAAPHDARITAFAADRQRNGPCRLQLSLAANAILTRTVTVRRTQPQPAILYSKKIRLLPGRPITIRLTDNIPAGQAGVWRATLGPKSELPGNDTATAAVLPEVRQVVWIARNGKVPPTVGGVKIDHIQPGSAPLDAAGWSRYAVGVLVDEKGTLLDAGRRKALAEAVRGGMGLVLIGSGPHETPVDRTDPLNSVAALVADPFRRNPLALTVVLDASGSMAEQITTEQNGRPTVTRKFDLAAGAVASLKRHLTERDRLKVLVFSDSAKLVYDSGTASPNFAVLAETLAEVQPAGATKIAPALQMAIASPPPKRHTGLVLVLSDLQTAPFDPAKMADRFKAGNWRLAVVATGSAAEKTLPLQQLAGRLGASLVHSENLRGLAKIFGWLCRKTRGDSLRRGRFTVVSTGRMLPAGKVLDTNAYILAAAAPRAEVLARVGDPAEGDPVLAYRQVGLGRSFTLALPPSAAERSGAFGKLLDFMVSRAARKTRDRRFDVELQRTGSRLRVRLIARDDKGPMNNLKLTVDVQSLETDETAKIETVSLPLPQIAPGAYQQTLLHVPAVAGVTIIDVPSASAVWRGVSRRLAPRELAELGADWRVLRKLAELTGGRIVSAEELRTPEVGRELAFKGWQPVWQYCLAAALAMMLLNWGISRASRN